MDEHGLIYCPNCRNVTFSDIINTQREWNRRRIRLKKRDEWEKAVDRLIGIKKRIPLLEKVAWKKDKIIQAHHRRDPSGAYPTEKFHNAIHAKVHLLHRANDLREEIVKLSLKIAELSIEKRHRE